MQKAGAVIAEQVFRLDSQLQKEPGAAGTHVPDPVDHHTGFFNILIHEVEGVDQGRCRNHRGTVDILMEHGNVHGLAEPIVDIKTLGKVDVFKDDAAKRGFQSKDCLNEALGIRDIQLEIEHIDIRQPLEKDDHPFLDRLGRFRPHIAQIRHRRAIGNDSQQVGARGVPKDLRRVFGNGRRGKDRPGQIGKAQLQRRQTRFGGPQFNLSGAITFVVIEGILGSDHKLVSQN